MSKIAMTKSQFANTMIENLNDTITQCINHPHDSSVSISTVLNVLVTIRTDLVTLHESLVKENE